MQDAEVAGPRGQGDSSCFHMRPTSAWGGAWGRFDCVTGVGCELNTGTLFSAC